MERHRSGTDAAAAGTLSGTQTDLARRALTLGKMPVSGVVIPMDRVAAVEAEATDRQVLDVIRTHNFSRLPVHQGRTDRIVGVLSVLDYLAVADAEAAATPAELMSPPITLRADLTVSQALLRLQAARESMAVVTDDSATALGIVTMKDLVEEIVGELEQW